MEETNIKSRVQLIAEGSRDPSMTVYEYNQLKAMLLTSNHNLKVGDTIATEDDGDYKVVDIRIEVLDEEVPNPEVGFEMALVGTRFEYNFEIQLIVKKI